MSLQKRSICWWMNLRKAENKTHALPVFGLSKELLALDNLNHLTLVWNESYALLLVVVLKLLCADDNVVFGWSLQAIKAPSTYTTSI